MVSRKEKSRAVFLHLTSEYVKYYIVWKHGLLKLANILNCKMTFVYADDVCLVAQAGTFEELENILNKDLAKVHTFFKSWHLTLNPGKSTSIVFHLNNREASRKLNLVVDGNTISTENAPKYLGIKLDRKLTFKQHLEDVKVKLKKRETILSTSWGCRANVLRISSLALVYSIAEYCAPVCAK